jgi:hypothetical protein
MGYLTRDSEDLIQAAIEYYRIWMEENNIYLPKMTPMTFIDRKYGDEIRKSLGLSPRARLHNVGAEALEQGIVKFESFRPTEKFTEKYKKQISALSPKNIPDEFKFFIEEPEPNDIKIHLEIPIEDWLKMGGMSESYRNPFKNQIDLMKENLIRYLGLEEGQPEHGFFRIDTSFRVTNVDEWAKKFEKIIKPEIKKLPTSEPIKAIKFQIKPNAGKVFISLSIKSGYGFRGKKDARQGIMELLTNKFGYTLDNITVD